MLYLSRSVEENEHQVSVYFSSFVVGENCGLCQACGLGHSHVVP